MISGVVAVAEGIEKEFQRLLPDQRVTQRRNLALLVATMLDIRSANLVDLAASLPRAAERIDMRFQWIWRVLMNPHIEPDAVMAAFAREALERQLNCGEPVVLILDQSKINARHQILMLALRWGERALPLLWRVVATEGAIGFATQKELLQAALPLLPEGTRICLMADRFYGTADLIGLVQHLGWDYRIRLKSNLIVDYGTGRCTTGELAADRVSAIENVRLTRRGVVTPLGIIRDPGHEEPWIVAMSARPGYLSTLDYSRRWAIEPMFSDFKSRGFGLEDTQIQYPDRLARLILVMALALYFAVSTGQWDAENNPLPAEKNTRSARPESSSAPELHSSPEACDTSPGLSPTSCHSQHSG